MRGMLWEVTPLLVADFHGPLSGHILGGRP